jgi:gas vesicle protein
MAVYKTNEELQRYLSDLGVSSQYTQQGNNLISTQGGGQFKMTEQGFEEITAPTPQGVAAIPTRSPRDVLFDEEQDRIKTAEDTAKTDRERQNEIQRQALEAELSRIEAETQNRIQEQQQIGTENLAKARGINIRAGLAGSPFAESLKGRVSAETEKAITTERQRGEQLRAGATGTFNTNVQKIEENYNARLAKIQEAQSGLFSKQAELDEQERTEALADFDALAKSGQVDFEKFKGSELLEGYSQQTGKSVQELELRFNANLPKSEASDFRWGKNGEAYQYNRITGEFVRRPDLDEGGGTGFDGKVQMLGDQIFIVPDQFTYDPNDTRSRAEQLKDQLVPYGSTGQFKKGEAEEQAISPYQEERSVRTVQSIDELLPKVNSTTVGIGSLLSNIPGTAAANFAAELDTLKSNIAFGELTAMREASKTGGALGQVSDKEGQLLESSLGALSTKQSPENFKQQLQKIKDSINRWREAVGSQPIGGASEVKSEVYTTSDGVEYIKGEDGLYYPK